MHIRLTLFELKLSQTIDLNNGLVQTDGNIRELLNTLVFSRETYPFKIKVYVYIFLKSRLHNGV